MWGEIKIWKWISKSNLAVGMPGFCLSRQPFAVRLSSVHQRIWQVRWFQSIHSPFKPSLPPAPASAFYLSSSDGSPPLPSPPFPCSSLAKEAPLALLCWFSLCAWVIIWSCLQFPLLTPLPLPHPSLPLCFCHPSSCYLCRKLLLCQQQHQSLPSLLFPHVARWLRRCPNE